MTAPSDVLLDTAAYTRKFGFLVAARSPSAQDQLAVRLPDGTVGVNPEFRAGGVSFGRTLQPAEFQALYLRVYIEPDCDESAAEFNRLASRFEPPCEELRRTVALSAPADEQIREIQSLSHGSVPGRDAAMPHLRDIQSAGPDGRLLPGELERRRSEMLADIAGTAEFAAAVASGKAARGHLAALAARTSRDGLDVRRAVAALALTGFSVVSSSVAWRPLAERLADARAWPARLDTAVRQATVACDILLDAAISGRPLKEVDLVRSYWAALGEDFAGKPMEIPRGSNADGMTLSTHTASFRNHRCMRPPCRSRPAPALSRTGSKRSAGASCSASAPEPARTYRPERTASARSTAGTAARPFWVMSRSATRLPAGSIPCWRTCGSARPSCRTGTRLAASGSKR